MTTIHTTLRTITRAAEAALPFALVLLLVMGCAPDCPNDTTAQLDQCVDDTPDERAHPCEALPRAKEDLLGVGALHRVDLPSGECFWMDRSEVTVAAYRRWLDELASTDVEWDKDYCGWKQARTELDAADPGAACDEPLAARDHDPFADRKPVRCVDFCDALAFCRWAGKHLCSDDLNSANGMPRGSPREWSLACTNSSSTIYPWGDEATAATCRALDDGDAGCAATDSVCGPDPVGEKRDCVSQAGALDLLGNVAEWSRSCVNVPADHAHEPRSCLVLGGSFELPLQSCALQRVERNDARLRDVGFRCCADLSQAEHVQIVEGAAEP